MPVYNEQITLPIILEAVLKQELVSEVVVVDDASSDESWNILNQLAQKDSRIRCFRHDSNRGKGAALQTGFRQASREIVLIQDSDLEYDPAEYPMLLRPILAGKADVVFGSRFLGYGSHRVLYFWHSVGNRLLTLLSNIGTNLNLTDMECGFKVFRKAILDQIQIEENRFGFEPEITAKAARLGARIYEVPISYSGRTYAEGKKIGWKDGISAIRCILIYNFLR